MQRDAFLKGFPPFMIQSITFFFPPFFSSVVHFSFYSPAVFNREIKTLGLYRISGIRPDIRPFYIRYPAEYPVSFAGYPVSFAGYPARKTLHGIFFLQNLGLHYILQ